MTSTVKAVLADRIRSAPNAALANRFADQIQGDVAHPAFIQRIGSCWALMRGGDHIANEGDFSEMRNRMAEHLDSLCIEENEEEDLPRVVAGGEVLDEDDILPSSFTFFDEDGTEFHYRYVGEDQYECRRWMPHHDAWYVQGNFTYGEEVTVGVFLMMIESA